MSRILRPVSSSAREGQVHVDRPKVQMFMGIGPVEEINPVIQISDFHKIAGIYSVGRIDPVDRPEKALGSPVGRPGPKPDLKITIPVEIGYFFGNTETNGVDHQ